MSPSSYGTRQGDEGFLGREFLLTRQFDVPRRLVFRAWTVPEHLAAWWGPDGFTNPVCELNVRAGGRIRIDMRDPSGTVYPMAGSFRDLVAPERIVFTAAALDAGGRPLFELLHTVTFTEAEGRTRVSVRIRVVMVTPGAAAHLEGLDQGWLQSLNRLASRLAAAPPETKEDRELVLARDLHAPRERVFAAWTDPRQTPRWWGPHGFTLTTQEMDVRPGGLWHFVLRGPDGVDYENRITYLDIAKPGRLVYRQDNGNDFDAERFETTVTFEPHADGTRLTLRTVFQSPEMRDYVVEKYGALEGGKQTLDRLAAFVAES